MTDITIPPKALDAAARAICLHERAHDKDWPDYWGHARDACLAMLKAWPGSYSLAENDSAEIRDVAVIIYHPYPAAGENQ